MHFVEDNHLARQSKPPNKKMLGGHHRKQGLIDSADAKRSKKRACRGGKPVVSGAGILNWLVAGGCRKFGQVDSVY